MKDFLSTYLKSRSRREEALTSFVRWLEKKESLSLVTSAATRIRGILKPALNRLALLWGMALLLQPVFAPVARTANAATNDLPFPLIERFENFGAKDGIPTHKVHCVLRASDS